MNVVGAPASAAEWADSRVVLRDGTVATLRVTTPADHDALRRFFHELSPESRWRRFFTLADPAETLIEHLFALRCRVPCRGRHNGGCAVES